MKKNNIVKLITCIFLLSACDLDRIPETDLSDAVYWQNADDFKNAASYLYSIYLPNSTNDFYPLYADKLSDNAMGTELNEISNGSYLPSSNFGPWDSGYSLIRAANKIIGQAEAAGLTDAVSRYVAEARFFRAWGYFDLVRRYGDVPLVLKTLDIDDEELFSARTPREEVIDAIYTDLDYAADNLPLKSEINISEDYVRLSSGTALAFKSRVALREGTWKKFHNVTTGNHDYKYHLNAARQAALDVMQSGEYELFDGGFGIESYKRLFKKDGSTTGNPESILINRFGYDQDNNVIQTQYGQQLTRELFAPTRSLVDAYLCTDGLPINQSPLYQGWVNANSEFIERDPRLDALVTEKGEEFVIQAASTDVAPDPYVPNIVSLTGYKIEKYVDVQAYWWDHIIIRYGEVLLNYAEAVFELDDAISDADLDLSVNLLRNRVGMPDLTNAFVSTNGLNMRDEMRRERRVELAMEGFRYDDLLRWKTAELELPKALLGVRVFAAEYISTNVSALNLTSDSVLIAESAEKRNFDASKQYLWPLPLNQLSLNQNLVQNPNW